MQSPDGAPDEAQQLAKAMHKQGLPSNPNCPLWEEARHRGQCCCNAVTAHCTPCPAAPCKKATGNTLLSPTCRTFTSANVHWGPAALSCEANGSESWLETDVVLTHFIPWHWENLFVSLLYSSICEMVIATVFLYVMVAEGVQLHTLAIFRETSLWQKPQSAWQKYLTSVIFLTMILCSEFFSCEFYVVVEITNIIMS